MMLLLSCLALAVAGDPHRWLEDIDDPAVARWQAERTERTLAWLEPDRVAAIAELLHERRTTQWNSTQVADHGHGTTLWYQREFAPFTEEALATLEDGDTRTGVYHTTRFIQRPGAEAPGMPLEAEGIDSTWGSCRSALSPDATRLLWGVHPPTGNPATFEPPYRCTVWILDLRTGDQRPLGSFEGYSAGWSPDGTQIAVSSFEGRTSRIRLYDPDTAMPVEAKPLLSHRRRLHLGWLPTGEMIARTSAPYGKLYVDTQRLAWGPPLSWLRLPKGRYDLVGERDGRLLLLTRAPDRRMVWVDPDKPCPRRWEEVFADTDTLKIRSARLHGDTLLMSLTQDGATGWYERPLTGGEPTRVLDDNVVHAWASQTRSDPALVHTRTAHAVSTYTRSKDGVYDLLHTDPIAEEQRTETLLAPSSDDTTIPISILRPTTSDGPRPVWIRTYGGFGISQVANFGPAESLFVEMGGVVVTVHARGGAERGPEWHEQARQENMGRTFHDVLDATEWLVAQGIAEPGRIAISGSSNGGLTATATMTQRPELFGAVISTAGVHDLIRGEAMGRWWKHEYGSPGNPEQRAVLQRWSPVHQQPEGMPPVLILTGQQDPTVNPAHSYKLAAAWEPLAPVYLRTYPWPTHLHNYGQARVKQERDKIPDRAWETTSAEKLVFLAEALEMPLPETHASPEP